MLIFRVVLVIHAQVNVLKSLSNATMAIMVALAVSNFSSRLLTSTFHGLEEAHAAGARAGLAIALALGKTPVAAPRNT